MRMGHGQVLDHMFLDGLEDAYDKGKLMGVFAENTADKYGFTREQQDAFAITSLQRAQRAIESGDFADEITPVVLQTRKGEVTVDTDEQPFNANIDKIPQLRPAFRADGTVTAANSSSISDGAAALVLMGESKPKARAAAARGDSCTRHARAGTGLVYDRAGGAIKRCSRPPAGQSTKSTCSKSTRPLRSSPWRR